MKRVSFTTFAAALLFASSAFAGGNEVAIEELSIAAGDGDVPHPRFTLRERQTQTVTPPVATRAIAIDPSGNTVYDFDDEAAEQSPADFES